MKPVQVREDDHLWLNSRKDRTGVPMATQIHFLIEAKKKVENNEESREQEKTTDRC